MAGRLDAYQIIADITGDSESSRKLAAYHLQTLVDDAEFAQSFVDAQGVPALKTVVLEENGNALAYALGSLTRLLEIDLGWDHLTPDVIERAVQIVVKKPVINVLRKALLLLVLVVSRPFKLSNHSQSADAGEFGFKALVPQLQAHSNFLDCLVDKLASADHALCANALYLVNALMRDSVANGGEAEWPRFIERLRHLGIIGGVETLMQGDALYQIAHPILEFQGLFKILLAQCRTISVDMERPEHQRALKQLHASSFSPKYKPDQGAQDAEKWQRLGFSTEQPAADLYEANFLGMMDLGDYVRRNADTFQKELLEQSVLPAEQRCPVARASLSVTMMLYEYFEVREMEGRDATIRVDLEEESSIDQQVEPFMLSWASVHAAILNAFLRLWKEAGAVLNDFQKIEDLVKLLARNILRGASRKAELQQVKEKLEKTPLDEARQLQLQDISEAYDYAWGSDLRQIREKTHQDSVKFMREQRIRCLLQGSWFPVVSSTSSPSDQSIVSEASHKPRIVAWRFIRLSHDRKYLHHASHLEKLDRDLPVHELSEKIDVKTISSVDSNISRSDLVVGDDRTANGHDSMAKRDSSSGTITRMTIWGMANAFTTEETALLEWHTNSTALASEWLDGLLMMLKQKPITQETNKLVNRLEDWSLKIRMLNLRWEDVDWDHARDEKQLQIPSKDGLDDNFWYYMAQ